MPSPRPTTFGQEVSGYQAAYSSEQSRFTQIQEEGKNLVVGRRNLLWLELYKAINDTLPRDAVDQPGEIDIQKRNQVSVTSITSERVADPTEWFDGLTERSIEGI